MPPKPKFTREEVIAAALSITREQGIDAVTAREVGNVLGVSSRPVFTYFTSMDELKTETRNAAKEIYASYCREGLSERIPFLGLGKKNIEFARKEPWLFRLIFLTSEDSFGGGAGDAMRFGQELARESVMRFYHMSASQADSYFRDLWLVSFSFSTMIVTDGCAFSDEQIEAIFTEISLAVCKAYKEIPGLPEGKYDRDRIFSEIVANQQGGQTC